MLEAYTTGEAVKEMAKAKAKVKVKVRIKVKVKVKARGRVKAKKECVRVPTRISLLECASSTLQDLALTTMLALSFIQRRHSRLLWRNGMALLLKAEEKEKVRKVVNTMASMA